MYDVIEQLLDYVEFELWVAPDGLHLVDTQRANLGGIEQEVFATLDEVVERLSTYINDYIIRGIEEEFDYECDSVVELYEHCMANGGYDRCPSLIFLKAYAYGVDTVLC